ncbi:MAG TPA: GNAT family N-acetyltransferase [Verrucomicrobiae bacterium]
MQTISIQLAETDQDILRCFPVLRELRPHLKQETFLRTIRQFQGGGYFLVMLEANGEVAAVAGYRFSEHLARGKFLYVDDLVTAAAARRKGHGQKLLDWLIKQAETSGCQELHLDSGVQRTEAHLFYEKQKMVFASRHYSLKLKPVC